MAQAWKVLGQSNPSAASLTDLYTVPSATEFTGIVVVANRSATPTAFRISVAINGAADSNEQYIAYDAPIGANAIYSTPPITGDASDKVRVYATLATLSFSLFGTEKT